MTSAPSTTNGQGLPPVKGRLPVAGVAVGACAVVVAGVALVADVPEVEVVACAVVAADVALVADVPEVAVAAGAVAVVLVVVVGAEL